MDKYELTIKIEQLDKLVRNKDYVSAAKVAEQIEWKKMKQWTVMSNAIDAFVATEKYDKARNVCIYAYNRKLGGRRLLATLMDMYVRLGEYEDAEEIYREYVEMAPRDLGKYTLLYRLKRAQGAPVGELIDILQEYKENELDEAYEYELALLYSEAGLTDRCVRECDELVLWFADGVYVEKALRLKQMHTPLTPRQAEKLERLERMSAMGLDSSGAAMADTDELYEEEQPQENCQDDELVKEHSAEEYQPKEQPVIQLGGYDEADEDYIHQPEEAKEDPEEEEWEQPEKDVPEAKEPEYEKPDNLRTEASEAALPREDKPETVPEQNDTVKPDYIDNIGNTTEWSPIEVEGKLNSITGSVSELRAGIPEKPETKLEPAQEPQNIQMPVPDMELVEEDYEINIKVPDYSVYDTRNVQQELKANVEEIMEAYHNREKQEELLEARELAQAEESSDPTKEIIINKHQWRKASRNTTNRLQTTTRIPELGGETRSLDTEAVKIAAAGLTVEQMAAIVAQVQAQQQAKDKEAGEDDQIEGQMDITQWLSQLEEEEEANVAIKEAAATVEQEHDENKQEVSSEASETEYEGFEEIPEVEETEYQAFEEIPKVEEPENEGFEAIPGLIKAETVSKDEDDTAQEPDMDDYEELPDLEVAINAGIEKIIDDTVKNSINETDSSAAEAGSYMLRPEERHFMEKYLYMAGMERRLCRYIGSRRNAVVSGTSHTGNVAIMGSRATDKTAFAVNLFKALHAYDENREQKLARISAERINFGGFESIRSRIAGQTLVIENAGALRREQISHMQEYMDSPNGGTLFILEDEEFNINKLFAENPDFADKFTGRFLLKQYTVNELVDIAKDYADEQGWRIEDKALLKLYLILSKLPNDDQGNIVNIVNDIIKYAGEHARNRLGNKLFGRFRSVLLIKESDFDTYDDEDDEDDYDDVDDSTEEKSRSGKSYDDEDDDDYDDDEDEE